MIINLNDDYQVNVQAYNNWILQRKTDSHGDALVDSNGNNSPKSLTYYPNLKFLLESFYKQQIIDNHKELSLKGYLDELKRVEIKISNDLARYEGLSKDEERKDS